MNAVLPTVPENTEHDAQSDDIIDSQSSVDSVPGRKGKAPANPKTQAHIKSSENKTQTHGNSSNQNKVNSCPPVNSNAANTCNSLEATSQATENLSVLVDALQNDSAVPSQPSESLDFGNQEETILPPYRLKKRTSTKTGDVPSKRVYETAATADTKEEESRKQASDSNVNRDTEMSIVLSCDLETQSQSQQSAEPWLGVTFDQSQPSQYQNFTSRGDNNQDVDMDDQELSSMMKQCGTTQTQPSNAPKNNTNNSDSHNCVTRNRDSDASVVLKSAMQKSSTQNSGSYTSIKASDSRKSQGDSSQSSSKSGDNDMTESSVLQRCMLETNTGTITLFLFN